MMENLTPQQRQIVALLGKGVRIKSHCNNAVYTKINCATASGNGQENIGHSQQY